MSKQKLSQTPLSDVFLNACKELDLEKVKACLTLGVDINCTGQYDESGLYHVVSLGRNKKLFDLFIDHPDLDVDQVNREEILVEAVVERKVEYLRKLCKLPGIDVNAGNPLLAAAIYGNKDAMEVLAKDPNLDWNNGNGPMYPITEALAGDTADVVEYLLQQPGLNLDVKLSGGRSVGHIAVECSSLECVELLSKDPRVNWNVRNDSGETPIMVALKDENMEAVKILLKTPGVSLDDVTETKEGKNLLKEVLQEAEEQRRNISGTVPECPV